MFTSALQTEGQNPYALALRPEYVNLFGPGYYWATYPLTRWLGNSYPILRTASVLFVLASCGLLLWALRIDQAPWWAGFTAAALLLGQLGQGLSITARPDGLGLCLLLGSLVIPHCCRFSPASLVAGGGLSVLAYLTKPYFVLGLPLVALYVFLFYDKRRGLLFGLAGLLTLAVALLLMNSVYECYLTETVFATKNAVPRSYAHLATVGGQFVRDNLGLIGMVVVGLVGWLHLRKRSPTGLRAQTPTGPSAHALSGPLFRWEASFPGLILACNCAVMVLVLGVNVGNDVLYYHQLITPFLLWLALKLASRKGRWQTVWLLLLAANIAWLGSRLTPWPKDHSAQWADVEKLVASHRQVFGAAPVSHLLARHGMAVYDTGQTEYARFACWNNPLHIAENYRQRFQAFLQDINDGIMHERFDLVLVCHGYSPLVDWDHLQAHYLCKGPVAAPMSFGYWVEANPLEMWVPRSHATASHDAN